MTVFLDFVSKDFGELGSLFERSEFEQVPKVCEQNRKECSFCDRSGRADITPTLQTLESLLIFWLHKNNYCFLCQFSV
jgi:hypothetical protein